MLHVAGTAGRPSNGTRAGLAREFSDVPFSGPRLNRLLIGWANYFCLGPVSKAYRVADQYTRHRLRQWLRAKHKLYQGAERSRFPDQYLEQQLGLVRLQGRTRNLPWANT